MKTEYKKLVKLIDQIMINSLFRSGGTKTEEEAINAAYLIQSPKKYNGTGFELCFLDKGKTEKDFCVIAIFLNPYNELVFSYGYNYYGKMYYQHKFKREEEKTILLLDYVFKYADCENFKERVFNFINQNESEKVKEIFSNQNLLTA
jgi:hypothetical protein